jgi:DNA-binding NtrC family response regulator
MQTARISPAAKDSGFTSRHGQPPSDGDASDASRAGDKGAQTKSVRVLVVDDQHDVLTTTVELFRIMGYEVFSASNGTEALAILNREEDIQVLFSDVIMPGMNGVALARAARLLDPSINVILASGFQTMALDSNDTDVRDFHFLSKPFRISDIARLLRK